MPFLLYTTFVSVAVGVFYCCVASLEGLDVSGEVARGLGGEGQVAKGCLAEACVEFDYLLLPLWGAYLQY